MLHDSVVDAGVEILRSAFLDGAIAGSLQRVKNAVHSGANIESRCGALSGLYIGDTALHIAASEGYLDIVRFLVEAGAEVDARNEINLYTPLHLAAFAGNIREAEELLASGADPNAKSSRETMSYTPLHMAAVKGHAKLASVLWLNNSDLEALNLALETPANVASQQRHGECARMLDQIRAGVPLVWTRDRHHLFPQDFKEAVKALLLADRRRAKEEGERHGCDSGMFAIPRPAAECIACCLAQLWFWPMLWSS